MTSSSALFGRNLNFLFVISIKYLPSFLFCMDHSSSAQNQSSHEFRLRRHYCRKITRQLTRSEMMNKLHASKYHHRPLISKADGSLFFFNSKTPESYDVSRHMGIAPLRDVNTLWIFVANVLPGGTAYQIMMSQSLPKQQCDKIIARVCLKLRNLI